MYPLLDLLHRFCSRGFNGLQYGHFAACLEIPTDRWSKFVNPEHDNLVFQSTEILFGFLRRHDVFKKCVERRFRVAVDAQQNMLNALAAFGPSSREILAESRL